MEKNDKMCAKCPKWSTFVRQKWGICAPKWDLLLYKCAPNWGGYKKVRQWGISGGRDRVRGRGYGERGMED